MGGLSALEDSEEVLKISVQKVNEFMLKGNVCGFALQLIPDLVIPPFPPS